MKRILQILGKYTTILINAFFVILKLTQCIKLYDELDVANYCEDQQEMCQDAENTAHIVCEYYGKVGSSCSKFKEVPFDESNAKDIIIRINSIRSHIAKGTVMGKDGLLPQGYGLMRISWDSELATFAKILINQCLTRNIYICAATEYFGNPMMIYMNANTNGSAAAIINSTFVRWEAAALQTSLEDILHCPDLRVGNKHGFINMLVGNVTNVGCALGIYKHAFRDDTKSSGHMICYFSHYPSPGTQVYNILPPAVGMGWSKCGCPPTLKETMNCLCVGLPTLPRLRKNVTTTAPLKPEITKLHKAFPTKQLKSTLHQEPIEKSQENINIQRNLKQESCLKNVGTPPPTCFGLENCKANLLMLPLFSIQQAPQHESRSRRRSNHNRHGNTVAVQPITAIINGNDFVYSDDDNEELPINRSQVLQKISKVRNQNINYYSYEENIKPDYQIMNQNKHTPESSQHIPEHSTRYPEYSQSIPGHNQHVNEHSQRVPEHSQRIPEYTQRTPVHSQSVAEQNQEYSQHIPKHSQHASKHRQQTPENSKHTPDHKQHSAPNHKQEQHISEHRQQILENSQHMPDHRQHSAPNHKQEQHISEHSQYIPDNSQRVSEHSQHIPENGHHPKHSQHSHHNVTTKQSHDGRSKKAKRLMGLLDSLETKGKAAHLNSQEIVEFDAKMRKIYKTVLATYKEYDELHD